MDRLRDVAAAGDVLLLPKRTFRTLRARAPVVAVWLAASLASATLTLSQLEILQRATAFLVSRGASRDVAREADSLLSRWALCRVWLAPLGIALSWCAEASLVQLTRRVARRRRETPDQVAFRPLLCVIAYASMPRILAEAIDLWVTWREGPAFTPELLPLLPDSTSLAVWLPLDIADPCCRALLSVLTPFGLWQLLLRVVGLRELFDVRRRTALAWAAPAWLVIRSLTALWEAALEDPGFTCLPARGREDP